MSVNTLREPHGFKLALTEPRPIIRWSLSEAAPGVVDECVIARAKSASKEARL